MKRTWRPRPPLARGRRIRRTVPADVSRAIVSLHNATAAHRIGRLYLGFAAVLLPWTAYLAWSLPQRSLSEHYAATWTGFDIALMLVLARVGWFAYHRDPNVIISAAAAAGMLITDAWFDVTTAASGSAHVQAILSALFLELPTAAISGLLARRGIIAITARAAAAAASASDPEAPGS